LICVAPDTAAGVQQSLFRDELTSVPTGSTVMVSLNCGTPSTLSWPYHRGGVAAALTVTDHRAQAAGIELSRWSVPSVPVGPRTSPRLVPSSAATPSA
jgi:diaminopropionate ammonia-lyase